MKNRTFFILISRAENLYFRSQKVSKFFFSFEEKETFFVEENFYGNGKGEGSGIRSPLGLKSLKINF